MCAQCDEWTAARTRGDWPTRLRRALSGVGGVKGGPLPATVRQRDERGRFLPVS